MPNSKIVKLVHSKEKKPKKREFIARVAVFCSDRDTSVHKKVMSYIKRELRSLRDVKCIKLGEEADYVMSIIFLTDDDEDGNPYRVQVASIFYRPSHGGMMRILKKYAPDDAEQIASDLGGLGTYLTAKIYSYGIKFLRELCEDIVTHFDTDVLQEDRDAWEEAMGQDPEE